MICKDKRFAQDPRFRFFSMNSIMRHGMLQKAGIYVNKSKLQEYTLEQLYYIITVNYKMIKTCGNILWFIYPK